MNNLEKVLKGGNLIITEKMFQEVSEGIEHFTKKQIMNSDLPIDLLLEIANDGWNDTHIREQIMDHLARKYISMSWHCYGDSKETQDQFEQRLKQFEEKEE